MSISVIVPAEAIAQIENGLDVHRWIKLWESDGRKIDEVVAIAFYHQALQDVRELLQPDSRAEKFEREMPGHTFSEAHEKTFP
jgi:hypothetical protein